MNAYNVLYSDRLVDITADSLLFKAYYFPFGAKRVKFSDIDHITEEKATLMNGLGKIHGGDFQTWLPRDWNRFSRSKMFCITFRHTSHHINFTVENEKQVESILQSRSILR